MRRPITVPKAISVGFKSRKPIEDTISFKASSSLLNQKLAADENVKKGEKQSDVKPPYSKTEPQTMVLYETSSIGRSKSFSGVYGQKPREDLFSLQNKELQGGAKHEGDSEEILITSKPGSSVYKLNSLSRAGSLGFLKKSEEYQEPTKEYKDPEKEEDTIIVSSDGTRIASKISTRTKYRPVSDVLLDYTLETKEITKNTEERATSGTSEKQWLRKPRPLSVDATAKFEFAGSSLHKRNIPSEESKENVPILRLANNVSSDTRSEVESVCEEKQRERGLGRTSFSKSDQKDIVQKGSFYDDKHKLKNEPIKKEMEGLKPGETNEAQIDLKEGRNASGSKLKPEIEGEETDLAICSGVQKQNLIFTEADEGKNKEINKTDREDLSLTSDSMKKPERKNEETSIPASGKMIKKCISLLLGSASSTSATESSPPSSSEKEKINVDIQQRIKELTTENSEPKQRSLQPRPLSTDLTKMFTWQTLNNEHQADKPSEQVSTSTQERTASKNTDTKEERKEPEKENEKIKEDLFCSKIKVTESPSPEYNLKNKYSVKLSERSTDKSIEFLQTGKLERKSLKSQDHISFTGICDSPSDQNVLDPGRSDASDNTTLKTVRASMFEHRVERQKVIEAHITLELPVQPADKPERKSEVDILSRVEREAREKQEPKTKNSDLTQGHFRKSCISEIGNVSLNIKREIISNEEEKAPTLPESVPAEKQKAFIKYVEDSLSNQRIEPKFDIIQTVSDRVVSEHVSMVAEDKAVTLRSKKEKEKGDEPVLRRDQLITPLTKNDSFKKVKPLLLQSSEITINKMPPSKGEPGSKQEKSALSSDDQIPKSDLVSGFKGENRFLGLNSDEKASVAQSKTKTGEANLKKNRSSNLAVVSDHSRRQKTLLTESSTVKTTDITNIENHSTLKKEETPITEVSGSTWKSKQKINLFDKTSESPLPKPDVISVSKRETRVFGLRKYPESSMTDKIGDHSVKATKANIVTEGQKTLAEEENIRKNAVTPTELKIKEEESTTITKQASKLADPKISTLYDRNENHNVMAKDLIKEDKSLLTKKEIRDGPESSMTIL
nr:PREDICTED: uncharacterized protein KIAA1671-like [Latimeria chalumnae]|eukprot:XP_005999513.2 PREDICTED: uncharacterized protein KIAA1671-like [Latimeria chalumnae]